MCGFQMDTMRVSIYNIAPATPKKQRSPSPDDLSVLIVKINDVPDDYTHCEEFAHAEGTPTHSYSYPYQMNMNNKERPCHLGSREAQKLR